MKRNITKLCTQYAQSTLSLTMSVLIGGGEKKWTPALALATSSL